MTDELTRIDADVLAALEDMGTNSEGDALWINVEWLYPRLPLCTHRDVDAAVTRLHDGGRIETKHIPLCHGGEKFYIRLAPAGGEKE